jgi:hypothetical protein
VARSATVGFSGALYLTVAVAALTLADGCLHSLGCDGDHSRLEKTETTTHSGGSGGLGGSGGGDGGSTTTSSGTGGIIEPSEPTQLTVVNGIVDQDATRHCFLPYPDSTGSGALPWPGVEGLPYSRGAPIDPIASVVPTGGDVELFVVGGALAQTGGETCVDLVASPPQGVELHSLGVLSAGVFDEQKSLLLVTTGCLGGPGHSDQDLQEMVCGPGYSEQTPNASLVAGFMSRLTEADKLPMQFVHASQALGDAVMRLRPGVDGGIAQYLVPQWSHGSIAPFPPYLALATADLFDLPSTQLEVYLPTEAEPISAVPWSVAFATSLLPIGEVSDGTGLVFVAVGPKPSVAPGSWWNGFSYAVLVADP